MGREGFETNHLGYVSLWVKDLAATRDALIAIRGLEVRFEDDSLVVFDMEGADLVLQRAEGETAGLAGETRFGFYTLDVDGDTERARSAGLELAWDRRPDGAGERITAIRLPEGQMTHIVGR